MRDENKFLSYILIVTFFLFSFPFFIKTIDIYNTRSFLYFSSFSILSLNPYLYFPQATPPFFMSILIPQFYLYNITLSLQDASSFFSLVNLAFTLLTAFITMKIILKLTKSKRKAHYIFYAIVVSPFLFYINFVFVEQDIIAIFLTLTSFYLIFFYRDTAIRIAGTLLLVYATFFYYFPVLMIPSLIVYQKNWKERLELILFLVFFFSLFLIFAQRNLTWSLLGNGTGAISPYGGIPVFSILNVFPGGISQMFSPLISNVYNSFLVLVLLLIVVIPIIFKVLKVSIIIPILISISLPFLFLKIYNGDEFIWIVPFLGIAFAYYSTDRLLKTKFFLSQMYMLPVLFILNMWGAPNYGQGTGIFYFTYMQFHTPIAIYSLIPEYTFVTKFLDVIIFVLIAIDIIYLIYLSRTESDVYKLYNVENGISNSEITPPKSKRFKDIFISNIETNTPDKCLKENLLSHLKLSNKLRSKIVLSVSLIFITALILLPFPFLSSPSISYSGGHFPVGLFQSPNYEMVENLSYNYMKNSSFIQLADYRGTLVPPSIFSRNITNQNLQMTLEVIPQMPVRAVYSDLVVGLNTLNLSILNQLQLSCHYSYLEPNFTQNVSKPTYENISLVNITDIPIFSMNGNSMEMYNLSRSTNVGHTYLLGFNSLANNYTQNLFFYSYIGGVSYEFYYSGSTLYFGVLENNSWHYEAVNPTLYGLSWNLMSFSMFNQSIEFSIDGVIIYTSESYGVSNSTNYIHVGMAQEYLPDEYKFAFTGEVTPLIKVNSTILKVKKELETSYLNHTSIFPFASYNITILKEGTRIQIINSNNDEVIDGNFSQFWFGRTSNFSPGVEYAFHDLRINSTSKNSLFSKIIFVTYGVPAYVTILVSIERKKLA